MTRVAEQPPRAADAPGSERKPRHVVLPGQTPEGQHIFGVLVKRSYTIVPEKACVRADKDHRLFPGDEHFGDPMNSTVEFETDFFPFKIATDVVLNGTAHAPRGRPTESFSASIRIGPVQKEVRVIGDRLCL